MRKQLGVFLLAQVCSLFYLAANGQGALPAQIRLRETMEGMSDPKGISQGEILYGTEIQPGRILGDYYLDSKWNKGS
ncbi:MAG TPA: hypothetical protein VIS49_05445, partial [Cyclobacteriaceae bacterium]